MADGEELNMTVVLAAKRALKINNKSKSKATDDSESEYESEKVNFEKLYIGAESDSE